MTDQSEPEEFRLAREAAETELKQGAYDPFERAQGRGLPEKTITIYWDELAARELLAHDRLLAQQAMVVAKHVQDLATVPDMIKKAAGNRAEMTKIKKAEKADLANLKEHQAKHDEMEAAGLELRDRIKDSAVTIHLSGFEPGDMEDLREELGRKYPPVKVGEEYQSNPEWNKHYSAGLIARAIVWTQRADETEPNYAKITPEIALKWRRILPDESYLALTQATSEVTLATGIFKSLEDAGFLAKS